ncbi:MAG: hypothetical protein V1843_02950 [bacterium]
MESHMSPAIKITKGNQRLNLDISNEVIAFWIVENEESAKPSVSVFIFSRKNKCLWQGVAVEGTGEFEGDFYMPEDEGYETMIGALRLYLGELFLLRPFDLRILDAVSEINYHSPNPYDSLLETLSKK